MTAVNYRRLEFKLGCIRADTLIWHWLHTARYSI